LNDQNAPSRLSQFAPPAISTFAALAVFAFTLGPYFLHYFPYEDDFSLIRYSAAQNSPAPLTWITKGFSEYFANDPQCATQYFGFDRPVANATFYLESLLYRSAEGPLLLITNALCWIISAWFVYGIARRLGASRWIASVGMLLYALSPCWYRVLIHASFRNNGLAACFLLAASYLLLKKNAVRSWSRLILAGLLVALAAGSHEQGFTSLPVFAVGVAWLSFKTEGKWQTGRIALAVAVIALPSLVVLCCFRLMNPMYGSSYATTGLLDSLSQSRHLASLGIHNPLLIRVIKLAVRVFGALISAMSALTPLGGENLVQLSTYLGVIIFVLVIVASLAIMKQFPIQVLPVGALILYAVGRSFGIPSAEPRFTHMEVAWGIIALTCALSAGLASVNRTAIIAGFTAGLGLLAFTILSYNATIVARRPVLQGRNEVDSNAYYRMEAAALKYPGAQVILVNDHAGIESARAMLVLAGFKSNDLEILPTIMNASSTDTLRDIEACPTITKLSHLPETLQIQIDYPSGCAVSFFGRDMECMVEKYRRARRSNSASWAEYIQHPESQGRYPSPLIHDVLIHPGRPIVIIIWRDRLSAPEVITIPNENAISLGQ
jgi:hypothetical protein